MNSPLVSQTHLLDFLIELETYAAAHLKREELDSFMLLARKYFHHFPLQELLGRPLGDVFGSLFYAWRLLQKFDGSEPFIRAFNPSLAQEGWICPHSVLLILQQDMPFLVDSIRIELNRHNIGIHSLKSTVLSLERDSAGQLQRVYENGGAGHAKEALIILEISKLSDEAALADIGTRMEQVLRDVKRVVGDFGAMKAAVSAAAQNLVNAQTEVMAANVEETREFLHWLAEDHFTFLGYSEYEFVEQDGRKYLQEIPARRLGLFALRDEIIAPLALDDFNEGMARFHLVPQVITFSKSALRAHIHRYAYSDYVVIKRFNQQGEVVGEARFLGLYTSQVYLMSPWDIPLIRSKVSKVFELYGLDKASHDGKNFRQILETFPRNEIFLSSSTELFETLRGVNQIAERAMVRLFMRRDPFGKFVNFLIYVPRDYFSTRIRLQIQELLGRALGSYDCEFTTYFSESILARVYLVFNTEGLPATDLEVKSLEAGIINITRSWEDHLYAALLEVQGEEQAALQLREYRNAFSLSYQQEYDARTAVQDIQAITALQQRQGVEIRIYQPMELEAMHLRFQLFHRHLPLTLSDVIPVLENLGFQVISESSYDIKSAAAGVTWLHEFRLQAPASIDLAAARSQITQAFAAIWQGDADNDSFNKLIPLAQLHWREVSLLRAYASYMHQTLFPFALSYIAAALENQFAICRKLVAYFVARFKPDESSSNDSLGARAQELEKRYQEILQDLDKVENLNEDRILRRYLQLMENTLRTNYFQPDSEGKAKAYISFKFSPRQIADIPEPRPKFEIFVFSPRMEAVHLRTSKVARGGLRWSDRLQDYRTEVLGLVKAQQVKNAVIVPSGAKGGFVCKKMPQGDRDAQQAEAIACYQTMIRGMLDITDNYVGGEVVAPAQVQRYDQDDPYLVVAADKGTASFSDIANKISYEYQHWLGDAFASGGSQGYDHKAMGITARGAWISVQRHFSELGVNVQADPVTVIGIGDMAGDVFGNGMLLSETILLVAAFNHQHIFIDPSPSAALSFKERQRLFALPKSTWADYDKSLISDGGGVFLRAAKSIAITPAMRERFAIDAGHLTPADLIRALLKAPVDLIWNGGIGTYVKSSAETHAEVGDKANDSLRINGCELRTKVFGEGGNLGMTQRGRIEYALHGGACNTDFIDNAGGVDCSDHEVNAKILLNDLVEQGDLTTKQRNQLLLDMTEDVARLVLSNNRKQTLAISIAQVEALARSSEYRRFMHWLQAQGRLSRALEFLPEDDLLLERQSKGKGLTRPELAVLISYAKAVLKEDLTKTTIAEDEYIARFLARAFPPQIQQRFGEAMKRHRLAREIVATQVANDMINTMGITFAQRLMESTGAAVGDVAKAYIIARDIYQLDLFYRELLAAQGTLSYQQTLEIIQALMRKIRRATRWFLRNRRGQLQPETEIHYFSQAIHNIEQNFPRLLDESQVAARQNLIAGYQAQGLPEHLIYIATAPSDLYSGLSVVEAARLVDVPLEQIAQLYFSLGNYLNLPWFYSQISNLVVENNWQAMARETFLSDLESQLHNLTLALAKYLGSECDSTQLLERWAHAQSLLISRWNLMVNELQSARTADFAIFSVALRDLLDLVQASRHMELIAPEGQGASEK